MSTPSPLTAIATGAPPCGVSLKDDERWFAEKIQPHAGQLRAYLREAFPAVPDVEDVVQESYLRVWRARTGQPIIFPKAFLFRVARNVALDIPYAPAIPEQPSSMVWTVIFGINPSNSASGAPRSRAFKWHGV